MKVAKAFFFSLLHVHWLKIKQCFRKRIKQTLLSNSVHLENGISSKWMII